MGRMASHFNRVYSTFRTGKCVRTIAEARFASLVVDIVAEPIQDARGHRITERPRAPESAQQIRCGVDGQSGQKAPRRIPDFQAHETQAPDRSPVPHFSRQDPVQTH